MLWHGSALEDDVKLSRTEIVCFLSVAECKKVVSENAKSQFWNLARGIVHFILLNKSLVAAVSTLGHCWTTGERWKRQRIAFAWRGSLNIPGLKRILPAMEWSHLAVLLDLSVHVQGGAGRTAPFCSMYAQQKNHPPAKTATSPPSKNGSFVRAYNLAGRTLHSMSWKTTAVKAGKGSKSCTVQYTGTPNTEDSYLPIRKHFEGVKDC